MRILLIDDDELVLSALTRLLGTLGFECDSFSDPDAALAAFGDGENFPVVLTDLMMPEMNGLQVMLEIRRRRPEVNLYLITGYDDQGQHLHQARQLANGILRKPVEVQSLVNLLREAGLYPKEGGV